MEPEPEPFRYIASLLLPNDLGQEVLERQSYIAIPVIIILLKHIRHPLQADAALHKQVEADSALFPLVVVLEQDMHELRAQPVAESHQRIRVLVDADVPASVGVESIE